MSGSYEKINYSLRPAKCIERKMLCESFQRLSPFGKVDKYRYVGFGSTYFSDFILFHRMLNIENMISIEMDEHNQERFEFNKPFKCIDIKYGEAKDVLPTLNWNLRSIVWLDYDGKLTSDVLADVQFIISCCSPGTLFLYSVNAQHERPETDKEKELPLFEFRKEKLVEAVGKHHVPIDLKKNALNGKNYGITCKKIMDEHIKNTLNARNGVAEVGNRMLYKQLYNFSYSDGAKMMTVGGILFDEGQEPQFNQCAFSTLSFFKDGDESYKIDVPNLTYKEIRELDSQLPASSKKELDIPVSISDQNKYKKLYRYFPTFSEGSL